jgi:hypothetical protein
LVIGSGCTRNRPAATTPLPPVPTATSATQERAAPAVSGQTIYVPAYSHIYYHDRQSIINLTVTLSVRNADPAHAIWVDSIHYYDATGRLVRTDLAAPLQLAPLATHEVVIEEDDTSGGAGASFLVKWSSDTQTVAPVVEAVMISAASTQGISFISVGRVIEAFPAGPAAENSAEMP